MRFIAKIILKLFGWEITGEFPDVKQSVVIMAPHTSNWDIVLGKLYMISKGLKGRVLVKKEFFIFPMNLVMNMIGAVPVNRNDKSNNTVYQAAAFFKQYDELHLVIAAEGTRKKISKWKQGFFHIAQKANVPIVVSYLNYKKKEVGIKGVIIDNSDISITMKQINIMYKDIVAKFPENFILDDRYNS